MYLIGDKLPSGVFYLHSSFAKVLNYYNADDLVSVVLPEIGASAVSIVVTEMPSKIPENIFIDDETIIYGETVINKKDCPIYNSTPQLFKALNDIEKFILWSLPQLSKSGLLFLINKEEKPEGAFLQNFAKRFTEGVNVFFKNPVDGAKQIKGLGFGLTPTGDDFLCGAIAALWIKNKLDNLEIENLIEAIYEASLGKNLLSNSFLKQSKNGNFFYQFKKLVENMQKNDKESFEKAAIDLACIGETSGSAMLMGLLLTLRDFDLPKVI